MSATARLAARLYALPPFLYNPVSIPAGWPFGLSALNHVRREMVYAFGGIWLLSGSWLGTRKSRRPLARAV